MLCWWRILTLQTCLWSEVYWCYIGFRDMIELFEINFTCFGVEHWLKHGSDPRNAFGELWSVSVLYSFWRDNWKFWSYFSSLVQVNNMYTCEGWYGFLPKDPATKESKLFLTAMMLLRWNYYAYIWILKIWLKLHEI